MYGVLIHAHAGDVLIDAEGDEDGCYWGGSGEEGFHQGDGGEGALENLDGGVGGQGGALVEEFGARAGVDV